MFDNRLKHLFSIILLLVILLTQTIPAGATVTALNYDTGAGLASTGSVECFPDKGKWSGREQLKIVPGKDGDEYQPVDVTKTFHVTWAMDFDGMGNQIATGMKYRVKLEVFGQFLDFDQAEVSVEFLHRMEGGRGYSTIHHFKKDVDGWNEVYFEGYVPVGAEGMLLRLQSHQYKGDAAIYFRNISVTLIDDTAPVVEGVLYNFRYDLKENAAFKDYYGLRDKVTMDVVFSEPVFVNDPGYLAYTRGSDAQGRAQLGDRMAAKYPYETAALSDVRNNNGKSLQDQFGTLQMRFTYKNSDGSVKIGHADFVDRTLLRTDPSPDQLRRLKFVYAVREGDEFKAEDISDMQLVGGVITDNAYNRLPDPLRKISSQASGQASADDLAKKDIYHQYVQNFSVETSPPVLISMNGNLPEGNVNGELWICLKYSEPVYLMRPDISTSDIPEGYRRVNPNLLLNGEYINKAEGGSLGNEAHYRGGDGTSQLEFTYNLYQHYEMMKRAFDPLEVLDSIMMCNPPGQRYEFGRSYIADAAGNVAPLVPKEGSEETGTAVKLSDSKYYAYERVPPEINISARKTENGYSVKMDVTDEGSGLNYDEVKFGIAGARYNYGFYNFVPGKEYSAKELSDLFNLKDVSWGSYFINVSAQDNAGNHANESIEVSRADFDVQPARIDNIADQGHGNYTISIADDGGRFNIASVRQKWVSSGTDPDLIEWAPVKSFNPNVPDKVEINPPQASHIWRKADLYIETIDRAGNRSVFSIPDAYQKPKEGAIRTAWSQTEQNRYAVDVRYNMTGDWYEYPPGVWFCMTQQPDMPPVEDSAWLFKKGGTIDTLNDLGMSGDTTPGNWYLHVRAADRDGQTLAAQTVPHLFSFDSTKPEILIDEKLDGNKWKIQVMAKDNLTLPEDITINYQVNSGQWKPLDNGGIITVEPGTEKYFTLTITAVDRNWNKQTFNHTNNYDLATVEGKLPQPYVFADYGLWNNEYGSVYEQTAYTRDDFAQLEVFTSGDEFSYSIDGVNWSGWLPLTDKDFFSNLSPQRYYELVNSMGYSAYAAYVPLPAKEGAITFHTRYRKGSKLMSDPVETTVVRDVTPPTASVVFTETTFTTIAKLAALSDNLSPQEAITVQGKSEVEFTWPGSHTFVVYDAAGNRTEVKATVTEVGLPLQPVRDTAAPVITITDTAGGAIVSQLSATISATDASPFTLKYAWSQDNDYGSIPAQDWQPLSNGSTIQLSCDPGQEGIWYLYVRATDSEGNSRVKTVAYTLDVTAPTISFQPDGSEVEITRAEVNVTVDDYYVVDAWHAWSQSVNPPEPNSGEWIALESDPRNEFRVSLEGVGGPWVLHFKAVDPAGNTCVESTNAFNMTDGGLPPDPGELAITLDGTPAGATVRRVSATVSASGSPPITLKIAWSTSSDASEIPDGEWQTIASGSTVILEDVADGTWYLHVSAADASGQTATARRSYVIDAMGSYTAPHIVYSGEEEGTMRAYIVSVEEITVADAVYCVLPYDPANLPATHDFQFTYPDGSADTITAAHAYPYRAEDWELEYKADVQITPSDTTTSGSVEIILEIPEDDQYTIELLDEEDDHDLYEYFTGNPDSVIILKGSIINWIAGTVEREITEDNPEALPSIIMGDDQILRIKKVKLTTTVNGNLYYNVGDGNFMVRIGHIVEASEQGNVTVTASQGLPRHFAVVSGHPAGLRFTGDLLLAANTKAVTGIVAPKAQITYTTTETEPKTVTAKIEFADSGMTVHNNGGENTRRFTQNGQFVFEYGKEGHSWRSLAQVSSFSTPEVDISYSCLLPTRQPVRVTMTPLDGSRLIGGVVQTQQENGAYWFETTENGRFSFTFENRQGNRATITPVVENIDNSPPVLSVDYINDYDSGTVKAVLKSNEALRIPEGKTAVHTFTENGEYVFGAEDAAGNLAEITAKVQSLPFPEFQSGIDVQVQYSTTQPTTRPVILTLASEQPFTVVNTYGKTSVTVYKNGTYPFIVRDAYGLYKLVEAKVENIVGEAAKESTGPVVLVNGHEAGTEPMELQADRLHVATRGFLGDVTVKWAQGHRQAAYLKSGGTVVEDAIPVSAARGWITLYVYDQECNVRLVHVLVTKQGGA